jgi:hypothetical protein
MPASSVSKKVISVCVLASQETTNWLRRELNPSSAELEISFAEGNSADCLIVTSLGAIEVIQAESKGVPVILLAWQYREAPRQSDPPHHRFEGNIEDLRELIVQAVRRADDRRKSKIIQLPEQDARPSEPLRVA